MFRRRWHQYIAVFFHNRGSSISVLNREISTKRKIDISLMDEIKRQVCEKDGFKQDDLALLNLIYLGKGGDPNVRTMETSQPDAARDEQKTEVLQGKAQNHPESGG